MATSIVLTMEGTLLNWLKQVGDSVNAGDIVAEVEADKATVEVEAPIAGVITALGAQVGDELKEGAVIGTIGAAGESAAPAAAPAVAKTEAAPAPAAATPVATGNGASVAASAATTPEGRVKASPVARNMAEERGIDLQTVQGSGPGGRIIKADIEGYQAPAATRQTPQTPTPAAPVSTGIFSAPARKLPEGPDVEILDISRMRARIAAGTVESKQTTPHFYVTAELNLDPLLALRAQINNSLGEGSTKVSVNDLIVKAAALAMRKFPNLNTHYYGDKLVRHKRINVASAVALEDGGVIYVVAKDADKLSLSELAVVNKGLVARAREGKIKPDDITGGTFSVSNLGPFDVEHFIAIINPPEAAVLAIGSGLKVPVVLADGSVGVQTRIKITISVDHRVSDGAEGAKYLQELRGYIENPLRLI